MAGFEEISLYVESEMRHSSKRRHCSNPKVGVSSGLQAPGAMICYHENAAQYRHSLKVQCCWLYSIYAEVLQGLTNMHGCQVLNSASATVALTFVRSAICSSPINLSSGQM